MPNVGAITLNAELKIIIYKISLLLKFTEKCRNAFLNVTLLVSTIYV